MKLVFDDSREAQHFGLRFKYLDEQIDTMLNYIENEDWHSSIKDISYSSQSGEASWGEPIVAKFIDDTKLILENTKGMINKLKGEEK